MSDVDLDQAPEDFADQATNAEPADPNAVPAPGQPTVPEPGGDKPPEVIPPVTPEAPGVPVPKGPEAPAVPAPEVDPETKPPEPTVPADPNGQPKELTPEEKQALEATQKITELGQENKKRFDSMVAVVRGNPDSITAIHESDPVIADQIAKELWGSESYADLMKQSEIEELKEKDPEAAKTAGRIYDLEKENAKTTSRLKKTDEETFFTEKGILNNPFDPKHKSLMEALEKVNPQLVKDNYPEALKFAYSNAFPARTDAEIETDKKAIMIAKATGAPKPGGIPPSNQRGPESAVAPEAQSFMDAVGAPKA